jgi:hypothetical protein
MPSDRIPAELDDAECHGHRLPALLLAQPLAAQPPDPSSEHDARSTARRLPARHRRHVLPGVAAVLAPWIARR